MTGLIERIAGLLKVDRDVLRIDRKKKKARTVKRTQDTITISSEARRFLSGSTSGEDTKNGKDGDQPAIHSGTG